MSKIIKFSMAVAVSAAAGTFYVLSQGRTAGGLNSWTSAAGKSEISEGRGPASVKEEVFKFQKSVNVNFDFSDEVIEQGFEGHMFMDWSDGNVATVGVTMPGQRPTVFVRAHFLDDFSLRCLQQPENLTAEEADYVSLIKNLILDYSFKTNRDDNGDYLAKLSLKELPGGVIQATKVKSKYLDPEKLHLKVTKSLHEVKISGGLKEAAGEEHMELLFNDKTAQTKSKYRLQATDEAGRERTRLNLGRKLASCSDDFSQMREGAPKLSLDEFKGLTSRMVSADRGGRQDAARKILKALKGNPDLLKGFMEWVYGIQGDRQLAALGIGILGNLGTPAAQEGLVGIFSSATSQTSHLQNLVLNAFTLSTAPLTGESRDFLKSQMEGESPLAEGAAYALGSSIQNDPGSPQSREDLKDLVHALESAKGAPSKMVFLDAIGNSGSAEAFSAFKKYAGSSNELIRERAIMGLRFIEDGRKMALYQDALNDLSPRVRQAAIEGMRLSAE